VNPLEVGVRGTVDEVKEATLDVLAGGTSRRQGMILSVGGGRARNAEANILAMLEAWSSSTASDWRRF